MEAIEAVGEEARIAVPERFAVVDAQSANWVVRKVMESRAYVENVRDWSARETRRAENEERFFMMRFGAQLHAWVREQLANEHKRKSICLPAGTIGFRHEPSKLEVSDEAALLAWCQVHLPEAIATELRVRKSIVADNLSATGELPPGVQIIEAREKFYLK